MFQFSVDMNCRSFLILSQLNKSCYLIWVVTFYELSQCLLILTNLEGQIQFMSPIAPFF